MQNKIQQTTFYAMFIFFLLLLLFFDSVYTIPSIELLIGHPILVPMLIKLIVVIREHPKHRQTPIQTQLNDIACMTRLFIERVDSIYDNLLHKSKKCEPVRFCSIYNERRVFFPARSLSNIVIFR